MAPLDLLAGPMCECTKEKLLMLNVSPLEFERGVAILRTNELADGDHFTLLEELDGRINHLRVLFVGDLLGSHLAPGKTNGFAVAPNAARNLTPNGRPDNPNIVLVLQITAVVFDGLVFFERRQVSFPTSVDVDDPVFQVIPAAEFADELGCDHHSLRITIDLKVTSRLGCQIETRPTLDNDCHDGNGHPTISGINSHHQGIFTVCFEALRAGVFDLDQGVEAGYPVLALLTIDVTNIPIFVDLENIETDHFGAEAGWIDFQAEGQTFEVPARAKLPKISACVDRDAGGVLMAKFDCDSWHDQGLV